MYLSTAIGGVLVLLGLGELVFGFGWDSKFGAWVPLLGLFLVIMGVIVRRLF